MVYDIICRRIADIDVEFLTWYTILFSNMWFEHAISGAFRITQSAGGSIQTINIRFG